MTEKRCYVITILSAALLGGFLGFLVAEHVKLTHKIPGYTPDLYGGIGGVVIGALTTAGFFKLTNKYYEKEELLPIAKTDEEDYLTIVKQY